MVTVVIGGLVTSTALTLFVLSRVEEELLRGHVASCVEHAIKSGDKADQRRKIGELVEVFGRTRG